MNVLKKLIAWQFSLPTLNFFTVDVYSCISYMQVELWHLLTYDFLENVVVIDMSVYMSAAERNKCIFTRESSYCFQSVLAIAILSVCLSVTRVDQSKTVQARIIKSSPSAAWKTLILGT